LNELSELGLLVVDRARMSWRKHHLRA